MKIRIVLLIACMSTVVNAQKPIIGKPVIAYDSTALMGFLKTDPNYHSVGEFNYDSPLNPVLQPDGKIICILTTPLYGTDYYQGILNNNTFLNQHVKAVNDTGLWQDLSRYQQLYSPNMHQNFNSYVPPFEGEVGYLMNTYVVSNGLWIGFIHIERSNATFRQTTVIPRNYAIGIAASTDQGAHWKYYGDIIRPFYDPAPPTTYSNIAGAPFIIINDNGNDYFYVYFNEWVQNEPLRVSVAREKVSTVMTMINNNSIAQPWKKYDAANTSDPWSADGFAGKGTDILFDLSYNTSATHYCIYNMHTDAVTIKSPKTYAMFPGYSKAEKGGSHVVENGIVYLQSINGIVWSIAGYVDSSPASANETFSYSSVFPLDNKGSIDGSMVNDKFAIIYPKFPVDNSGNINLRRPEIRRVDVRYPSITSVLNLLLD